MLRRVSLGLSCLEHNVVRTTTRFPVGDSIWLFFGQPNLQCYSVFGGSTVEVIKTVLN